MLPYVWILGIKIPMYSVMIFIGVALGLLVALLFPCKKGVARQDIRYVSCYIGIGVFVGAKILFLLVTVPQLLQLKNRPAFSWTLVSQLFSSGFVFYGGVLGGILGAFLYAKQFRLPFLLLLETLIPSVPLIHAFGRIGCFCAGCCYGIPVPPPWGVYFASNSVAPKGVALLPIQLIEAVINLCVFVGLFAYSRRQRPGGHILGVYFAAYGIERFILEFFRGDKVRGILFDLSTSQWISIALVLAGGYLLLRKSGRRAFAGAGR